MGKHRLQPIVAGRAALLGVIALCAAAGCWEEIEYTGPDPSKIARRPPRSTADAEHSNRTVDDSASQPSRSPGDSTSQHATVEPKIDTAGSAEGAAEPETSEENLASDKFLIDDLEPEEMPATDTEATATAPEPTPATPAPSTRRAAWQLGSKLTLAALAHDRRLVPGDVEKWFAETREAAEMLGTSVADLPEPAAATESDPAGSRGVHDYLFQQGQRIWHELTDRHGADHAALFEVAVRSNVLLVLYQPGSPAVEALASSIREAAPRAELPAELWQPLLDTLAREPPAAEVRAAVRRMHADVEQYLSDTAEQE